MTQLTVPETDKVAKTVQFLDPDNVYTSKRFIRGQLEHKAPSELIDPVIAQLKKSNLQIRLSGEEPITNANTDDSRNTAFARVNIIASCEIDTDMRYEIGILYAMNTQIPKIKIYRGAKVSACLNLSVFNAEDIASFDMANGMNFEIISQYIVSQTKKIKQLSDNVARMKKQLMNEAAVQKTIGDIFINATANKSVTGVRPLQLAVDLMVNPSSRYYYKQPGFNSWQMYNAFTEYYSVKKDMLFEIPDKSLATTDLLTKAIGLKLN